MRILTRVLQDNVMEFGEYPFLYDGDAVYSNVDTLRQAQRIRDLLAATGMQPGNRVLVSMPNRAEVCFVGSFSNCGFLPCQILHTEYIVGIEQLEPGASAAAPMFHFDTAVDAFEGPIADLRVDQAIFHRLVIFPQPPGILGEGLDFAVLVLLNKRIECRRIGGIKHAVTIA